TVEMLSRFVEDKLVVKMRSRDGAEEVARTFSGYRSDGLGVPIIVLVNEDTASAAEIFAGVLHDYRLATIVGEHTYGKASVQNIFSLRDGSSAKVTIARYFLPSGVDIGRRVDEDGLYISGGLQPDIKFVPDPDDPDIKIGDSKHDPQLRKAIDLILAKQPKD
ncbi:MAG: hypothetical protein HY248_02000, partial [Fimbriimonas ginsengisoli]|nr:hypothetical protein [Fimbriimonas ginsengisoli]